MFQRWSFFEGRKRIRHHSVFCESRLSIHHSLASYSRCRAIQENSSLPQKRMSNLRFGTGNWFMGPLGCIDRAPRVPSCGVCICVSTAGSPQRLASTSIFRMVHGAGGRDRNLNSKVGGTVEGTGWARCQKTHQYWENPVDLALSIDGP